MGLSPFSFPPSSPPRCCCLSMVIQIPSPPPSNHHIQIWVSVFSSFLYRFHLNFSFSSSPHALKSLAFLHLIDFLQNSSLLSTYVAGNRVNSSSVSSSHSKDIRFTGIEPGSTARCTVIMWCSTSTQIPAWFVVLVRNL